MRAPFVPNPALDAWRAEMEIKEAVRHEAQLAKRMKCPTCGEIGTWLMYRCRRTNGEAIPDGAYCQRHAPGGYAPKDGSVMALGPYGWVDEGDGEFSTWEDDADVDVVAAEPAR